MNVPSETARQLLVHYINSAHAANGREDAEDAVRWCQSALAIDPNVPEAWYNLGIAERRLGHQKQALHALEMARVRTLSSADAQNSIGLQLSELGAIAEAEQCLARAISLAPESPLAHSNLGMLRHKQQRLDEAESLFRTALKLQPDSAIFYANLGSVLQEKENHEAAEEMCRRASHLDPQLPQAWTNLASALASLGRDDEALQCYDQALVLQPDDADTYYNRGVTLIALGQEALAMASFRKSLALDPDNPKPHWNLGHLLISAGDYAQGWEKFDHRWQIEGLGLNPVKTSRPLWAGHASDQPLLLWGEQGIGDQILFSSVLAELDCLPQKKWVALDPRLIALFERSLPGFSFIPLAHASDALDFAEQLPLGSLPRYFRATPDRFAAARHPFLRADPARVAALRKKIAQPGKRVCGVSWFSSRKHLGQQKSIDLAQLLAPLARQNLHFVNLQYGNTSAERKILQDQHGISVQNIDDVDNFNDIDGLAALIEACDVVITTSNTTAHLAGALAKETLLLLPLGQSRFWYWSEYAGGNPWYPSIRSFIQIERGQWHHPLRLLKEYLEKKPWN